MNSELPFVVQCGHPNIKEVQPRIFESLRDIFPYLFHENEESAYLFWHGTPIQFHYTYELYKNIDEVVGLCWLLQKKDRGELIAKFMLDSLFMEWYLEWENGELTIYSKFESRKHSYDLYAEHLNSMPIAKLPLNAFLSEWKVLLMQLTKAIQVSGVTIEDGIERRRYETMLRAEKKIVGLGVLYKQKEEAV